MNMCNPWLIAAPFIQGHNGVHTNMFTQFLGLVYGTFSSSLAQPIFPVSWVHIVKYGHVVQTDAVWGIGNGVQTDKGVCTTASQLYQIKATLPHTHYTVLTT